MAFFTELHIPHGVRFECTGCGNCCLSWPVPLTAADAQRIQSYVPAVVGAPEAAAILRRLPADDRRFQGFTHTLEKRADGKCTFLMDDNRCSLHAEHGIDAKPSMCRLFPYAFTETPDGVFAYVSFASSGVLLNSGRLLSEQQEVLQQHYGLYKELFPNASPDWSKLQWLDGAPMSWQDYRSIEEKLLAVLDANTDATTLERLADCSKLVVRNLPKGADPEKFPRLESRPRTVDQLLLAHLDRFYLPHDLFNNTSFDMDVRSLMTDLVNAPHTVTISGVNGPVRFQTFLDRKLGRLPGDSEAMLNRFAYTRVFAKLFFGPGFGHLSLLAGIHHLFFLVSLVRLRAKQVQLQKGGLEFLDVAEILQALERRLTQISFSAETIAALEVLLSSPSRLDRITALVQ